MSRRTQAGAGNDERDPRAATPSLAAGYLVALPLFLAYELGLLLWTAPAESEAGRASAERVVALGIAILGERLQIVRVALLLGLAFVACIRVRADERTAASGPMRALGRSVLEGVLAGLLFGPVLVLLQSWLAAGPLASAAEPERALGASLRLIGAAPWEELLFRVGVYGGLFLLARRTLGVLGRAALAATVPARVAALHGACLVLAA